MEGSAARKPFRWGFGTAVLAILSLICVGQAGGVAMSELGPEHANGPLEFVAGMRAKDWLFVAFVVSAAAFVWLQRAAVARFFRSMHVGASLIGLSALAVITGVLVPQIENFEDPTERVPAISDLPEG